MCRWFYILHGYILFCLTNYCQFLWRNNSKSLHYESWSGMSVGNIVLEGNKWLFTSNIRPFNSSDIFLALLMNKEIHRWDFIEGFDHLISPELSFYKAQQ